MLKGEHVVLGPPKREYIDTFLKWMNDPEITKYLIPPIRPFTREIEEEWYDSLKNRDNFILFSILVPEENGIGPIVFNGNLKSYVISLLNHIFL